ADWRQVVASGWGYSDDYHDWTCGIIRDRSGNLYVGLGSNYSQQGRVKETSRWRGKVLRISRDGRVEPVGHAFRYPTGLAIDSAGRIFVSDNQGVQNPFNEINHLVTGRNYGVPSRFEEKHAGAAVKPAIRVPHPWSRSVNGLAFLPTKFADGSVAGHGIGCEYDNRFLVRFTVEEVGGEMQGAVFHFSRPGAGVGERNFVGPLSIAVSPGGDIYIGNIYDSGWLGGRNTGTITKLSPVSGGPNGMRDLKVVPGGLRVVFAKAVDRVVAAKPDAYTVSGYTRVWKGGYTTGDSGRHRATVTAAVVSGDGTSVTLAIDGLRTGHVYEVTCGRIGGEGAELWPATGHYSLHRMPKETP
ncbi:MAG: PQQ-dependent sugar dehydrogenase, partial [Planctomycetaceae bacterium]